MVFGERAEDETERIPFQGAMLCHLAQESEDISYQALIHQVPRGDLAWAVRARTNTLATSDNMARWGKRVDTQCQISNCGAPSNLGHIRFKRSLDRFQFRHDSVLLHIVQKVLSTKSGTMTVYADLDGWRVNRGTMPQDLSSNPKIPDRVLVTLAWICKIRDLKTFRRKLWKISQIDSYRIYLARG